jgi:hypothetical protein
MKVGDLIRVKINAGPWSTGLVCNIESSEKRRGGRENRYWTLWEDGDYSWISEKDYAEIINESR